MERGQRSQGFWLAVYCLPSMTPRPPQGPPPRPEPAQIVKPDKVQRVQFAVRSQMLVAKQLESPLLLIGCDSAVDNTSLSKIKLYYTVGRRSIVRAARATRNNDQPTKWLGKACVYPKVAKNAYLWTEMAFFGPNILIFSRGSKRYYIIYYTHIRKSPSILVCTVFWSGMAPKGPER